LNISFYLEGYFYGSPIQNLFEIRELEFQIKMKERTKSNMEEYVSLEDDPFDF